MGRRAQRGDERAVPRRAKKTLTMTKGSCVNVIVCE